MSVMLLLESIEKKYTHMTVLHTVRKWMLLSHRKVLINDCLSTITEATAAKLGAERAEVAEIAKRRG